MTRRLGWGGPVPRALDGAARFSPHLVAPGTQSAGRDLVPGEFRDEGGGDGDGVGKCAHVDAQDPFGAQRDDQAGHRAAGAEGGDDMPDAGLLGEDLLTRLPVSAGAQRAGSAERHQVRHCSLALQLGARLPGPTGRLRGRGVTRPHDPGGEGGRMSAPHRRASATSHSSLRILLPPPPSPVRSSA
ncbi:hypothetical protein [Streptomyces sp. NPDC053367]|uniref:hypothetical protein n=1 Tax=Streptomyces sp. NPDC053367 TaxID=3365700 RepID=UPI0037D5F3D0